MTHVPKHGSFAQWKNGPVIKRNKARAINGDAFTVVLKTSKEIERAKDRKSGLARALAAQLRFLEVDHRVTASNFKTDHRNISLNNLDEFFDRYFIESVVIKGLKYTHILLIYYNNEIFKKFFNRRYIVPYAFSQFFPDFF